MDGIWANLEALRGQIPLLAERSPRFRKQRRETIKVLEDLLEKLQSVSKCADVGRGVGSATVLLGGLSTLVGSVLVMRGKNPKSFLAAGKGLKSFGGIVVPGVNLLELGITEVFLQQVKNALQRDQEVSRQIRQFVLVIQNLDRQVRETFGNSICLSSVGNAVENLFTEGLSKIPENLLNMSKQFIAAINGDPGLTTFLFNGMCLAGIGVGGLEVVSQFVSLLLSVKSLREGSQAEYCRDVERVLTVLRTELEMVTRLERALVDLI